MLSAGVYVRIYLRFRQLWFQEELDLLEDMYSWTPLWQYVFNCQGLFEIIVGEIVDKFPCEE